MPDYQLMTKTQIVSAGILEIGIDHEARARAYRVRVDCILLTSEVVAWWGDDCVEHSASELPQAEIDDVLRYVECDPDIDDATDDVYEALLGPPCDDDDCD